MHPFVVENNKSLALHEAIAANNLDYFYDLICQPDVDLNYKNDGVTPLIASMRAGTSRSAMAQCLIEMGCDVNLSESPDGASPIYVAIECNLKNILHLLVQKGADINAPLTYLNHTPLHLAVYIESIEFVCCLLYYGADVNIVNSSNSTPLLEACSEISKTVIAKVLLNYYDDFSHTKAGIGFEARCMIIFQSAPLAVDFKKTDVESFQLTNWVDSGDTSVLHQSLYLIDAELFKFFWFRVDYEMLLFSDMPFLLQYVDSCCFSNVEWLECLYLILKAPIAFRLIDHCKFYTERIFYNIVPSYSEQFNFLSYLLRALRHRNIQKKDRMSLIYICLSLNAQIQLHDLQYAYRLYGFNAEFEALLYAGNLCFSFNSVQDISRFFKDLITNESRYPGCNNLEKPFYALGLFSMPLDEKQDLERWALKNLKSCKHEFLEKLNEIPMLATLRELSRNAAQKYIKDKFKITKLYRFHDAVKNLNLPQVVKDIILFKKLIY